MGLRADRRGGSARHAVARARSRPGDKREYELRQLDGHLGDAPRRDEVSRHSPGNCRGSRAPHRVGCADWGARRKAVTMTIDASDIDVRHLPVVVDLPTAARLLGVGRTSAYELVRTGQWPTPVIRAGRLIRVPTGPLLVLLCLAEQP